MFPGTIVPIQLEDAGFLVFLKANFACDVELPLHMALMATWVITITRKCEFDNSRTAAGGAAMFTTLAFFLIAVILMLGVRRRQPLGTAN
jgi:hypothetical protein